MMGNKYRKKPVVIEAFRYGIDGRPDWFQDKVTNNEIITHCGDELSSPFQRATNLWCEIPTLEGTMKGNYSDYIIKGINGEVYPCKAEIFHKTYEMVEGEELRAIDTGKKEGASVNNVKTVELSQELEKRDGVTTVRVNPHEKIEVAGFTVEGPAVILINKD